MCFVLELNKPLFCFTINGNRYFDGAGINFVTLVKIGDQSSLFEEFHTDKCHIHQGNISCAVLAVDFLSAFIIKCKSVFYGFGQCCFFDLYFFQSCQESGMTAMVRPVGVDHTQLCYSRISVFVVTEIIAAEFQIRKCHGKAHAVKIIFHLVIVPFDEPFHRCHISRNI